MNSGRVKDYSEADRIRRGAGDDIYHEYTPDHGSSVATASVSDHLGKSGAAVLWLGVIGCVFGVLGFAFGTIALFNTSEIVSIASDAARAAAKAETATASGIIYLTK